MKKAVVLNSGGMDSATTLAIAKSEGYSLYSLTFDYEQKNVLEVQAAAKIAKFFQVKKHLLLKLPLGQIGGSTLLDKQSKVPKHNHLKKIPSGIPSTYVPARNTIFLSLALAWAEAEEAGDIFIGVNALDYSGYPDCREPYIKAFQKLAVLATKSGVGGKPIKIQAPLLKMSKEDIIKKGLQLGVDYSLTWSCYEPQSGGKPCRRCASCLLREKGFEEAKVKDPLLLK